MSTFVLVHGGMVGSQCWKKIRPLLESKGHRVLTPTLTGLGERKHLLNRGINLETHIQDVVNTIYFEDLDNIILIGHSYGGMVATGVTDRIRERVKKLIYLAAVFPLSGESMFDAVGKEITTFLKDSASESGSDWTVPIGPPEGFGITNIQDIEWFKMMTSPHPLKCFEQKLTFDLRDIQKVYIHCSKDFALEPIAVRAKSKGASFYEIESGHFPMITHPLELADLFFTIQRS